ncbi:MAG: hypothetical protein BM485_14105 [Desulfobulbaceae bacterium DB1]|nr:MAG: hypothetical protein BM485_14105 [Desulfobulbaceae bacterium DB1]
MQDTLRKAARGGNDEISQVTSSFQELIGWVQGREAGLRESEERLREITTTVAEGIFVLDREGRITFINPAAERLLGCQSADVLGKGSHDIFHHCRPDGSPNPIASCPAHLAIVNGLSQIERDEHFIKSDGSFLPVSISSTPIIRQGVAAGAVVTFRDISERLAAEEKTRELAAIVSSAEEAIIGKTPTGIITSWNRGAEKIYGYREEEVIGRSVLMLSPAGHDDEMRDILATLQRGEAVEHLETTRRRKDGREIDVALTVSPIKDNAGRIIAASVIGSDITRRKQTETQLARTMDALRREEERLSVLLQLSQRPFASERELTDHALEEMVRLTRSEVGYLHFFHENKEGIELYSWSRATRERCTAAPTLHYPLADAGIWADSIRLRQAVIHNDYPGMAEKNGLPDGHFPLSRHLSTPIFSGERLVAVIGVGNKEEPYDETDVRQINLFMNTMWNILMQRRAEEDLAFRSLMLDNAIDSVFVLDLEGRMVYANRAAYTSRGYSQAEMLERGLSEIDTREQAHLIEQRLRQIFTTGEAAFETTHSRKDGTEMEVEVFARLVTVSERQLILSVARDITERKKAARELLHAKEEAEAATRTKSEFLANMSHEIRTPLNAIIGMADLLKETPLTHEQREYVQVFENNGEALLALINDIIDLSKVEAGRIELDLTEFSPLELLEGVCSLMALKAHEKGLELHLDLSPDVPLLPAGRLRPVATDSHQPDRQRHQVHGAR